ncbi:hypothetical protein GCM10029976_009620 [Kribbella albertanoniae]|uniref:SnoaL-like domain-containing protein n=1 Tax=Kribbella albertanoniae TaxID=1266829 RepID=A0A4R4QDW9_9ACTN|nr:nuclear transport factor 2 family protein [Kribbella albertanoniae]TDC33654.1 hypothetical protein E1261_05495 [Kribbella albertanoniae]
MTVTAGYKELVLRLCAACNAGDRRGIEAVLTPDFADAGRCCGPDRFAARLALVRRDVAEFRWDVLGLVAEGTTVALRVRLSGITGGRRLAVEQMHIYEGRDGRIASRQCVGGTDGPFDRLAAAS